jgi:hypothetical protein
MQIKINYESNSLPGHDRAIKDVWVNGEHFVSAADAPLPDEHWAALVRAEHYLYRFDGGYSPGYNAWTDMVPNDGSQLLNAVWEQAEMSVDMATPGALHEIARRVAAVLGVLSFGKEFLLK